MAYTIKLGLNSVKSDEVVASILAVILFVLLYLALLGIQHISGTCDDFGGVHWSGDCAFYKENGVLKRK